MADPQLEFHWLRDPGFLIQGPRRIGGHLGLSGAILGPSWAKKDPLTLRETFCLGLGQRVGGWVRPSPEGKKGAEELSPLHSLRFDRLFGSETIFASFRSWELKRF